jgi:YidC/Oxa1 family membrane protein insertase
MDRNTIIGLVLIGSILSVFTIFNQPSAEEQAKQQKELAMQKEADKKEKAEDEKNAAKEKEEVVKSAAVASNLVPKLDKKGEQVITDKGLVYIDTLTKKETIIPVKIEKRQSEASPEQKGELIRLENEKLIVDFSTKGGKVAAVYLKGYKSYKDYVDSSSTNNKLLLFADGDAVNQLIIPMNGKTVRTGAYLFDIKKQTADRITFKLDIGDGKIVEQSYKLKKDAFDLDYKVHIEGFSKEVNAKNVTLNWDVAYKKTERLFSEQRRVSTVCMNYSESGLDYLSEMADDDAVAEEKVEWVAYKQSYFSSILKPENGFAQEGTTFKVRNYKEGHERAWTHLKDFSSKLNLNLSDAGNATVNMNWFFGPNDYQTLKSYDSGYDDILNFGWGLFRWINLYAVQPVFTFLVNNGIGIGWAILFLTLILKLVLMPIQWKMYVSSAKMRILKPQVDELAVKYPDKADAMKKQMEMMTLYRESGASPLAGCVPMLIQMPILLAVFRFFPSAFELRQKSFLWAEDLSSYDSIWNFGIYIWPYGDHVSLFTLLMAGTTLVYTVMNSGNMQQPQQPGMPNMKVIMYIFPIMMIFFFNNYSSGLSYYYFISTLISILMMLAIKKFFVDEEKLKLKMANRKTTAAASGGKEKKKSKFQERLEQMQKAQQEAMKNKKK